MSQASLSISPQAGIRAALPCWFFSLVLHGTVAALFVLGVPVMHRGGASEDSRHVGLVVLRGDPDGSADAAGKLAGDQEGKVAQTTALVEIPAEREPVEAVESSAVLTSATILAAVQIPTTPSGEQPAAEKAVKEPEPPASASDAKADSDIQSITDTADRLRADADGPATGNGEGVNDALRRGKGRTEVFGLPGEGYKFVYVFDRSASMGGRGRSTLAAAKAELLKSLGSLGETHQFQIIFYNEEPSVLNIAGRSRLVFGTRQNKELARRFVGGITADGGTRHEEALMMALKMRPDVIFFLTDADQPELSPAQLKRVHEIADGVTTIHTIEFGAGPNLGGENFLERLAHQNSGEYAYFDVAQLNDEKE